MEIAKGICRIAAMAVLAIVITSMAFFAGYTLQWAAGTAVAAPVPVTATAPDFAPAQQSELAGFSLFWEAWGIVNQKFYGGIPDDEEVTYGAIRGAITTLGDQNTVFIDPEQAKIFSEDMSGIFEGIGAAVRMDENGQLTIVEPFADHPAANAGLRRGDIILKVDDTVIEDMNVLEAIALIRGPAGTTVVLTIHREGVLEPFEVSVVRERIEIPVVSWRMLPEGMAYIQLSEFSGQATGNVREALQSALREEPKGLIFDLRNNPGGYLNAAVEITGEFLDGGNVVIEQMKAGEGRAFPASRGGLALDIPLVVLVNGGSASATEITAGAIQDRGRGILIGEETFGKGSVQEAHTLSDDSQLRVTVAHWLTPNGKDIDKEGLTPDIIVELSEQDIEQDRDPQLERAVEYLLSGEK
jgi:carboxyl-terminal processing protease